MRDLEYRAWNGTKMLPVSVIDQEYEKVTSGKVTTYVPIKLSIKLADGEYLKFDQEHGAMPVMKSIDAYDLDERRIFEGDIIQHKDRPEFSGMVKFAKGSAFAIGKTKTDGRQEVWSGAFMERHCVVIGNAYENPELMDWFKAAPVAEEPTPPKKKSHKKH